MSREAKILAGIVLVITAGMIALFMAAGDSGNSTTGPKADLSKLSNQTSHKTGAGPIQVVEFGDYQCPACKQAHPIMQKVLQDFDGKINFVFRNFPLEIHKNAKPAAYAAEAAAVQNKFWEMHDKLYEHQTEWATAGNPSEHFDKYAAEIGLDIPKFKQDSATAEIKKIVQDDLADGNSLVVQSTPTFYVDGMKATSFDYNTLKGLIDDASQKK